MPHVSENKRYTTFNAHLKEVFGENVYKVTIDAGFTCPNRDGAKGVGCCIYCYGDRSQTKLIDIPAMVAYIQEGMAAIRRKYHANKFLAYFQSYTNTYAPLDRLEAFYRAALAQDGIVGLSIGTRPDCVPDDVLDLLESLARQTYLWVEYGLQSAHDATLTRLNRGHAFAEFADAVERTRRRRGIRICAHLILGLPGETRAQMIETAEIVSRLGAHGVKIHSAHVVKNTVWAEQYACGEFAPMELPEYVQTVCDVLEHLAPEIVIHRLIGDAPRSRYIAPEWCLHKSDALRAIDAELERRDSWQGKFAVKQF